MRTAEALYSALYSGSRNVFRLNLKDGRFGTLDKSDRGRESKKHDDRDT